MDIRRSLFMIAFAAVLAYVLFFVNSCIAKDDWKKKTSPLPKETVISLCTKLLLPSTHKLCDGSNDVYSADFSRAIRDRFPLEDPMETPKSKATISYDEVQEVLGEYNQGCEDVVHLSVSNYSYFRCSYDLRGDGFRTDAFYFYSPENTLFSIRSSNSDP